MPTPNAPSRVPTPPDSPRHTPRVLEAIAPLSDVQRQIVVAAEAARRRAEDANRSKLEWLRAMSHELRTPLNAIGGFVQLLKSGARGEVPEVMRADLDRIERNQHHMAALIEEVLHFARLDAGHVHFETRHFPVNRLLMDLQDYVPRGDRARGRTLEVHRCSPDIAVLADEDKSRQILLNLITNALKHTPPGSGIEVFVFDARAGESHVRIAVRDGGPGIPADRLHRVFEPFFQVDASLHRQAEGLGLGLTIARGLARGMNGDLSVTSVEGDGATFILSLLRAA